jgi:hypothetical protein
VTQVAAPKPLSRLGGFIRGTFTFAFMLVWTTGWLVGTVALDAMVWRTFSRAAIALGYQNVTGKVVRNDATSHTSSKGSTYYKYRIAYAYEVGGRTYESSRMRLDGDHVSEEWARAHPVGSEVGVFYDPRNPAEATLATHLTTADLAFPLVAIIFNVVAIGVSALMLVWIGWILSVVFRMTDDGGVVLGGGLSLVIKSILRPWSFRWLYVLLAAAAATILVLGLLAGRGALRVIPLAIWALILWWLVRRLLRPWTRQAERLA